MNLLISQLLDQLKSTDEARQQRAVVQLTMLLQRMLDRPAMDEFLSEELLALRLPRAEVDEVLEEALKLLHSDRLYRNTKISLFWVIMNLADMKYAEPLLQFFTQYAPTFNEQDAYSSTAQLTQFVLGHTGDPSYLRSLLQKFNILNDLENFKTNYSPALQESATWLINYLKRIMNNQ